MPGFSFSTIEPNRIGQVTKWDVPLNEWMGLKFGAGTDDTLGNAISRATEDFIWDDDNPVRPDVLNRIYGIDGQLKFDAPLSAQRARLMHERKRKELERLSYLESASHSWASGKAAAGFAAAMVGSLFHPADLGLSFLPFIGSEKAAAQVAKLGGGAWRSALQRGVISEEALAARGVPFHRLTAAVIDGTVNQAVMEIPIALQKHRDQAIYGPLDSAFNIIAGGAFAGGIKGLGLALERAGYLWMKADPRMREAAIMEEARALISGDTPRTHEFFGMDEAAIRAKVDERVRAANPFVEPDVPVPIQRTADFATSGELIAQAKRGEFPGYLTESDAKIINRLLDRFDAGERTAALFDSLAAYLGKRFDAQGSLRELRQELGRTIDAITKSEELLQSDSASIRETAQRNIHRLEQQRNSIADEIASTELRARQEEKLTSDVREQATGDYIAKAKADHEAKIKGVVDAETARVIAEVKRQSPPLPKEDVDRYTVKSTPDDTSIKAIEEDAATMEKEVLNRAATPEERTKLESEIKAELKGLDESPVSAEKAVDQMTPCIIDRIKL